jgi:hypothetical protein
LIDYVTLGEALLLHVYREESQWPADEQELVSRETTFLDTMATVWLVVRGLTAGEQTGGARPGSVGGI